MIQIKNSLRKVFTGIVHSPEKVIILFKKSKVDNFVGGLLIGALISIAINLFSMKIQEDISRQKALEAVEREMTYHLLDVKRIINQYEIFKTSSPSARLAADSIMNTRFSTKVWDNTEIYHYLLELDPKIAASLETHYEIIVKPLNSMLSDNEELYKRLYEPCKPFYEILTQKKAQTLGYCNVVALDSTESEMKISYGVIKSLDETKKLFHPTKDRLNNWWLKFLLGDKTVNILR
jgi:hypothetical protein